MQNFKEWFITESNQNLDKLNFGEPTEDVKLLNAPTPHFKDGWKGISLKSPPKNSSKQTRKEIDKILGFRKTNSLETKNQIKAQDLQFSGRKPLLS